MFERVITMKTGKHRIYFGRKIHAGLTHSSIPCLNAPSLGIHCIRTNGESTVLFGSADKFMGLLDG
jgi:hypothetical protein